MNVATRLQVGQQRNCGSNPGVAKRFFCFPKCLDHLWGPSSFSSVDTGEYSPLVKKLELEAVSSLASKNKWSYMQKSQVPGHLGD